MLVYLYNMHLFYATQYKLIHWRIYCKRLPPLPSPHGSFLYTNTARGERESGSSKGERKNSRRQRD